MSIRIRSLLSIGFSLALLIAGLAGLSLLFSSYHYRQLEQETARHTGLSAKELLSHEADRLATLAKDWSLWNGLAAFLREGTPGFTASEFTPGVLGNLRIQAFLLRNSRGENTYATYVLDADRVQAMTETDGVRWKPLLELEGMPRTGLIMMGDEPWLVSSQPVSEGPDGSGPFGRLVFARHADEQLAAAMARLLYVPVRLLPLSRAAELEPSMQRALLAAQVLEPLAIRGAQKQLAGATVLPDLDGNPALVLITGLPRTMGAGRPIGNLLFVAASGLAGLLFAVLVLMVFQHNMTDRLPRLVEVVRQARQQANPDSRVTLGGAPELVQLGAEINGLLDQAARSRIYRSIFDLLPTGLLVKTEEGTITDANPAFSRLSGYERPELIGQPAASLVPEKTSSGDAPWVAPCTRRDGTARPVEWLEKSVALEQGQRRIVVLAREV